MERQPYVRLNFGSENAGQPLNVEQLVAIVRQQIRTDNHMKGCRLPPVRALAHQLGLSKNTVQAAYEELQAQGLVESKDRTGYFVVEGQTPLVFENPVSVPSPAFKNIPYIGHTKPRLKDSIPLSSVFVDPSILPKEKLASCFRSVLKSPGIPEFHDPQGMPALREKIAARLNDRGIKAAPEHIIITNGSQQALDLVTRALVTKVVATEDPAYHLGRHLFAMNGMETVGLPIDPFTGMNEKVWEERLRTQRPGLAYLTTNFQNANGYSYTSTEIARIVNWAREYQFGILEDDWGYEMLSYSEFKPGLRAMGGDNVLYMNSFTKKLLPSLRIGYLLASEQTVEPLLMAKRVSTIAVAGIMEAALFEFLDRGYYDTHLRLVQEELDIRYEHCLSLLRELMPPSVKWNSPGGGPVLWLEIPPSVNLPDLAERMRTRGVWIQLPSGSQMGEPLSHGFKIGYAFISQDEMQKAIELLADELNRRLAH